eukprot:CAMPEP_0176271446 /NCGR_PEP_ID=MMETSP0121_2-20121125/45207_1 /TAXON_ID=160619 /ORGANISM="Kryptoperidinium foliaceum, Strain CCMP 1326" /LENGTH=262 /DNA_ID=CAMNT_0017611597 /DNA_START=252 /DNA_END=1040 /DNA_ORIENTATION=+
MTPFTAKFIPTLLPEASGAATDAGAESGAPRLVGELAHADEALDAEPPLRTTSEVRSMLMPEVLPTLASADLPTPTSSGRRRPIIASTRSSRSSAMACSRSPLAKAESAVPNPSPLHRRGHLEPGLAQERAVAPQRGAASPAPGAGSSAAALSGMRVQSERSIVSQSTSAARTSNRRSPVRDSGTSVMTASAESPGFNTPARGATKKACGAVVLTFQAVLQAEALVILNFMLTRSDCSLTEKTSWESGSNCNKESGAITPEG